MQLVHGAAARRLHDVGERYYSDEPSVADEEERRLALVGELFFKLLLHAAVKAELLHQLSVAAADERAVDFSPYALARLLREIGDGLHGQFILRRFRSYRLAERMARIFFKRRRERQELLRAHIRTMKHVRHGWLAARYRTSFVEDDGLYVVRRLERLGGFYQDSVRRAAPRAYHDRRRRSEAERAGTRNYQHRDGDRKRELDALARYQPSRRGDERYNDDDRHENAAYLVRELSDRGLRARRLVHKPHYLRERRLVADARRAHFEIPGLDRRRAYQLVARLLLDRYALARYRRLVDRGVALRQHAVDRHGLAGAHHDGLALLNLFDRNFSLDAAANDESRLWREVHQLVDCVRSAPLRASLEELPHRDERQYHARRLEIKVHREHAHHLEVSVAEAECDFIERVHAVDESRARAESDKRIHIRRTVRQRRKADAEELKVDEHDGNGQQEQRQRENHSVLRPVEKRRKRPAHHVPHRNIEKRHGEYDRGHKPPPYLLVFQLRYIHGRRRGLSPRPGAPLLLAQRSAVPGLHDRLDDSLRSQHGLVVFDGHAVLQ